MYLLYPTKAVTALALCLGTFWDTSLKVQAFSTKPLFSSSIQTPSKPFSRQSHLSVAAGSNQDLISFKSAVVPEEDLHPIFKVGSGEKEKIVNAFGLWALVVSLITCPIWYLALKTVNAVNMMFEDLDPNREIYDFTGKIWSRVWLFMTASYPEITGEIDQIKKENGACLYVANHASWLDIPIVCTVLDPVFKFISKGSLKGLPCIGDQLVGGKHILIDREDRRSQLRTFKEGIAWLQKGVPLMAFPEGQRSNDGHLMEFKGGAFSMAVREKVPIVPITISNAYATMPSNSFFPVQPGSGKLAVHIHPAIHVDGKTEDELEELVRNAIMSKLPLDQLPHPKVDVIESPVGEKGSSEENPKELQASL